MKFALLKSVKGKVRVRPARPLKPVNISGSASLPYLLIITGLNDQQKAARIAYM